jgi:hypothetical protein
MKTITNKQLRKVVIELMGAEISDYTSAAEDEERIIQKGIATLRKLVEETIVAYERRKKVDKNENIFI